MTGGSLPEFSGGHSALLPASPTVTRDDALRIVRSLAGAQQRARRSVSEASLFLPVRGVAEFSQEEATALARAAIRFFDLDLDQDLELNQNLNGSAHSCGTHRGGAAEAEYIRRLLALPDFDDWAEMLHESWNGKTLSFHSSGSTGIPVRNRHTLASMAEEGAVLAGFFPSRRRIVTVMPAHHIFGLMHSLWLAKWMDVPVVHLPPLPTAGFFETLREGDVVMAFPFFWQSLLAVARQRDGKGVFCPPQDVTGVTATGPCPPWVIAALLDAEAGRPLLAGMQEIYGSSETNGLGIRYDGGAWYELYATWNPVVMEDGTRLLRRASGAVATIPVAAEGACSAGNASSGGPTLVPLPDVVEWHPENPRKFRPERRVDTAVQVAGVNVYPEEVAAVLRTHPLVRDCAVRLMRPEEGSRLKAFIVPACPLEEAAPHFGREFRAWLAERLDAPRRPKHIRLGAELPANAMGKAADWE